MSSVRGADVVIIGGGVIGLCCAHFLQKSGRAVTLIDQGQIGAGSAGNAGHIVPSHIVPLAAPGVIAQALRWMVSPRTSPFSLRLRLDPGLLVWLRHFAAFCTEEQVRRAIPVLKSLGFAGDRLLSEWLADDDVSCGFVRTGLLNVYRSDKAFETGAKEAEVLRSHGLRAVELERSAVRRLEPALGERVVGGVHLLDDAHLDPGAFLREVRSRIEKRGADVITDAVIGFDVHDSRVVSVRTSSCEVRAESVVVASGAWSPKLGRMLGLNLPVQPGKGYSVTVDQPRVLPSLPLLLAERRVAVTPIGSRLRLAGRMELAQFDSVVPPRVVAYLQQASCEYIGLEGDLRVAETWSGLRPLTPDGLPIIGRAGRYKNLILATGHAMLGLSLGPVTGSLVAQLVNGETPDIDVSAVSPCRFGA